MNGRAYTTFYITGTVAIAAGATWATRIIWSLATIPDLAAVWGPAEGPYRWTGSPATEGMTDYLVDYVGGGILVSGTPASQFATPDNGTAAAPGRNGRSFFIGTGRAQMPVA